MMYVLQHRENGKFVTPSGSEHSYTRDIRKARIYGSRTQAESQACIESECAVPLVELLHSTALCYDY